MTSFLPKRIKISELKAAAELVRSTLRTAAGPDEVLSMSEVPVDEHSYSPDTAFGRKLLRLKETGEVGRLVLQQTAQGKLSVEQVDAYLQTAIWELEWADRNKDGILTQKELRQQSPIRPVFGYIGQSVFKVAQLSRPIPV